MCKISWLPEVKFFDFLFDKISITFPKLLFSTLSLTLFIWFIVQASENDFFFNFFDKSAWLYSFLWYNIKHEVLNLKLHEVLNLKIFWVFKFEACCCCFLIFLTFFEFLCCCWFFNLFYWFIRENEFACLVSLIFIIHLLSYIFRQ